MVARHGCHRAPGASAAVVHRNWNTNAVALGITQALCNQAAIIDLIAMCEHHPLGDTRGTGRVLDIGNVLGLDATSTLNGARRNSSHAVVPKRTTCLRGSA